MLRIVYRVFCSELCQPSMGFDPLDSIFLGSKLPEKAHLAKPLASFAVTSRASSVVVQIYA
jgi:hypothetical protein